MIEGERCSALVEVPRPQRLGREDAVERGSIEVFDALVVENHRSVEYASQRWKIAVDVIEYGIDIFESADIAAYRFNT